MKTTIQALAIFIAGMLSLWAYEKLSAPKAGWVNVQTLYQNFEYRKETEKKFVQVKKARNAILDSLELELKMMAKELQDGKVKDNSRLNMFQVKREDYYTKKNAFDEDNTMMQRRYEEQVLNQLNAYVKAYGEKNHYRYIHGADGSGSLMYADKAMNITDEVSAYVNESYKGKN